MAEHPTYQHLQLQRRRQRIGLAIYSSPDLEPLFIRGQRTDSGL